MNFYFYFERLFRFLFWIYNTKLKKNIIGNIIDNENKKSQFLNKMKIKLNIIKIKMKNKYFKDLNLLKILINISC